MEIVYLIGNGFDLNMGLKTKYSDFYSQYIQSESIDESILRLKQDIGKYLSKESSDINWSDFELDFGRYTSRITSVEELINIYEDVNISLHHYIKEQELSLGTRDKQVLIKDLMFPAEHLREIDKFHINDFATRLKKTPQNTNIITFNYTKCIENILNVKNVSQYKLGFNNRGNPCYLHSIKHIHGCIGDNILVGVNDINQIHNEQLKKDNTALDLLIKPQSNKAIGSRVDEECIRVIEKSNLMCLFGLSLGDSDIFWWNLIGEQLLRTDFRLILFVRDNDLTIKHLIGETIKFYKEFLLSKTDLSLEEKNEVGEKIFIGYNTEIFKL